MTATPEPNASAASTPAESPRRKASIVPFVLLGATVLIPSLFWYRNTLARRLDDAALQAKFESTASKDLDHALAEMSSRLSEAASGARSAATVEPFYPSVVAAAAHQDPQVRLRAAWVMGDDPKSEVFRTKLLELVADPHPLVVWNAAPALAKHGSAAAREPLLAMLKPHDVVSPVPGVFVAETKEGRTLGSAAASRIGHVNAAEGKVEITAGVFGPVRRLAADGSKVEAGGFLAQVGPAQSAALNALVALSIPGVGLPEDVAAIDAFLADVGDALDSKVAAQARATKEALDSSAR